MSQQKKYLECEKLWVFVVLIFVAGFYGAYTMLLRGGVFCNAQTGNLVLLALALGEGNWSRALYLILPITAYFLGAVVSEAIAGPIKKFHLIRWDTLFIIIEIIAVIILGLIPETAPYQITQVTVNFICSMQYNTFRQAEGIPMATTFVTNHIRQTGIWTITAIRKKDPAARSRAWKHFRMVAVFFLGGLLLTLCCSALQEKAIWVAVLPLAVTLVLLLRADLISERQLFDLKPHGH
jgi:uncharacterized membrane protein YoaK (UPF0700 family)